MSAIFTPLNQVKLTNVSVVRLKKGGKRFEVACYKNKVMDWRRGLISDLSEVIQIDKVFTNVSKGQVANQEDLLKSFKTNETSEIIVQILKNGELQVSEKERLNQNERMLKDIVHIIAEKSVHPETKRPYTITMIEKALLESHFSLVPNKTAKVQALDAIKLLQEKNIIPIIRARMRVRIQMPSKDAKRVKDRILQCLIKIEEEDWSDTFDATCLIDPGQYRLLYELIQQESKGKCILEMLNLKDVDDKEEIL
ncbi:Ribosome maturation protein SBDS domain-containing protein [Rozella allomycis CSF55]|uniref:Ribosome maturation protein SBDS domain-containing protein n=1 Tax=Rozella allomycis (strain CSF55) TaxID=988480 RepID=A0A075AXR2_ROZAC|nr:Ribosome maturation protein SBDS domain-containing protein [Rozella allomycis CSF55]|eukprot:EPZ34939.1 Ribosome maturation protein SBDS domain-containing protein [Rozella allomycis CSF55]